MSSGAKISFHGRTKKAHLIISNGVRCSQKKDLNTLLQETKPKEETEQP